MTERNEEARQNRILRLRNYK